MSESGSKLTDEAPRLPIADAVQQADQAAGVADRLLEPDDRLVGPASVVVGLGGVFVAPEALVRVVDGEDEQEGVGRAWHEGEEVRVRDAVDVVEVDGRGESELVDEIRHYFGVVFCGSS